MGRTGLTRRQLIGTAAGVVAGSGAFPGSARASAQSGSSSYIGGELTGADRTALRNYAVQTWRCFDAMVTPLGLPTDKLNRLTNGRWVRSAQTSTTNVGCYLWSTVVAEELGIIDRADAIGRIAQTVAAVSALETYEALFYNWYDSNDGATLDTWPEDGSPLRPFLSSVDNAWLATALVIVRNGYPELGRLVEPVLAGMDFGFFYTPYDEADPAMNPGQMRGGYWPDGGGEFTAHHYGTLNSETRMISYVGIGVNDVPAEHYYRMYRTMPAEFGQEQTPEGPTVDYGGVEVFEGTYAYLDLRVVPSWGGSMFEALMPALFVPEDVWGPTSWAINHPLYVEAQIRHGLEEARYGAWGFSPASVPEAGYQEYGVDRIGMNIDGYASNTDRTYADDDTPTHPPEAYTNGVVTPHAVFLALPHAPVAAMANLRGLVADFAILSEYGFMDSVNVDTGVVSPALLSLDQGMIMGAIGNALGDDVLRRLFGQGQVEERLRPLIEAETFTSGRVDG